MPAILAIDQGTTGSTCLVVGADGRILGRGYREIPQHYPQPGWVEHDPRDLVDRTLEAAREAIERARVTPVAIGITNQRETVVLWDRKTGEPLGRALVWQDRRTADRCLELASDADALDVYRVLRAANPSPYMYLLRFSGRETPFEVVGSSPEALVKVTEGRALLHPIAGTRPRGT